MDTIWRCNKCGATEDSDAIEKIGLCVTCAHRDAISRLRQDLQRSYGGRDPKK